ncbi:glutamate--tRNA ligase [Helicobacter sp. CLO-3]|uniref:glutamate--tRNA ligase n=1 Tax=Helicobacter sp. CLO-3 TaxID=211 RepID=UPI0008057FA1|nr:MULTISPECIES: glutamate--tRNA ligase [unclassified Helicobacter]OBV29747.1 glutamate--tRNA ligase [Helicobacter sp. CLO-3]OHU85200.1 glutamate--tRNA ligase [Helicobacter sp. CLO-3]
MLRFAPSPTGDMHIGNLRAAIFNYILAKQRGERFLIRIEDTDMERNIEGKDKEILQILTLFGLLWDELVYQSGNFERHRAFASKLLDEGKAFYCYCSKEFLESKKQEAIAQKRAFRYDDSWADSGKADSRVRPVVRLKGSTESIAYDDMIKGHLEFAPNELDSFVILREDGVPTYNFACACDDMIYDISAIVRGEDHTSNTPKQILVHKALGYAREIEYAHLPIILGESGKKMSKRDSASSVAWLLEEGFLPSAICNYLIAMGNSTPQEIFTLNEAIEWFDIKKLAKSPVRFDIARLRFINHAHLQRLEDGALAYLLESVLDKEVLEAIGLDSGVDSSAAGGLGGVDSSVLDSGATGGISDAVKNLGALGRIYLEEASTLNELRAKITPIFMPKDIRAQYEGEDFSNECEKLLQSLAPNFANPPATYDEFKKVAMEASGLKGKAFFKPLRILLSGASHGPDIALLYPLLRENLANIMRVKS